MKMNSSDQFAAPWNSLELTPPHLEFFESSTKNTNLAKQAIISEHRLNKIRDLIFLETITLTKFMSSRKNKYRSDKGFQCIPKIVKAVNKIYFLDLKTITLLMKANLSSDFVPSAQLCQWLLIKLMSYGLLLNRVKECCKNSVFMLHHRLRTGHSWVEITLPMAMISRIWSISTFLLEKCCSSYKILVAIHKHLPLNSKDKSWIFMSYEFPKNLKLWIDQPHVIPTLNCNTSHSVLNSPNAAGQSSISGIEDSRLSNEIKKIKCAQSLKRFIVKEQKCRQLRKANHLSKHLSSSQWHTIERSLLNFCSKLSTSENKMLFLKKIRKKIHQWFSK